MRLQPHHHQNGKWPKTTKRVSTAKKTIWTMISVTSGRVRPIPTQWYLKYNSSTLKCVQACPFTKPNVWFLPPPFTLTMTNYELQGTGSTRTPVAQTLQSVHQMIHFCVSKLLSAHTMERSKWVRVIKYTILIHFTQSLSDTVDLKFEIPRTDFWHAGFWEDFWKN